jgi:hypothetical protein
LAENGYGRILQAPDFGFVGARTRDPPIKSQQLSISASRRSMTAHSAYLFAATGERILWDPTVLDLGDAHANCGLGMRFNLLPPSDRWPAAYGFVEGSRRTGLPGFSGDRIFAGMLLQY